MLWDKVIKDDGRSGGTCEHVTVALIVLAFIFAFLKLLAKQLPGIKPKYINTRATSIAAFQHSSCQ